MNSRSGWLVLVFAAAVAGCGDGGGPAESLEVVEGWGSIAEIYATGCASCHGAAGEGNNPMVVPAVYVFQDWYLGRQFEKFQTKDRKSDPANEASLRMHARAMTMVLEEDVRDVAGYIVSRLEEKGDAEP